MSSLTQQLSNLTSIISNFTIMNGFSMNLGMGHPSMNNGINGINGINGLNILNGINNLQNGPNLINMGHPQKPS